ncbi:MAG: glycogen debranching N-terminal domain-containing protein [Actinomycetota bacterium]
MSTALPVDGWSLSRAGLAWVTARDGTIEAHDGGGIYARDRRLVEGLRLLVDGYRPRLLGRTRTGVGSDRLVYGHWGDGPDPVAIILRDRRLGADVEDRLEIRAFRSDLDLDVRLELDAGGGPVYDLHAREHRAATAELVRGSLRTDGFAVEGDLAVRARVKVRPGAVAVCSWALALGHPHPGLHSTPTISTDDPILERALRSALWDLDSLTVIDPSTGTPFLAAGAPHFLAAFGRDALVSSALAMLAAPERALDTLAVLANAQGAGHDPSTLEEPGRILHELRIGEMGVFGLSPGAAYYGSVDATPLFVVLLAECLAWGVDRSGIGDLLPAARRAVEWCRSHVDRFGFVQSIPHDGGIGNQGWKDSGDSMVRPDGTVIEEATSLAEVQGYVHAALTGLAELEAHVAGDETAAAALRREADDLAERFRRRFAVGPPTLLAMALDEAGRPLDVRGSNVAHLLATGIVDDRTAAALARRLVEPAELSGWGLRTLAETEAAYNPLGYHRGSVWPHDTAVFLRGLNLRGLEHELGLVAGGLIDLTDELDGELPELLGGFARDDISSPVTYPASARPQAWAASVPIQIVTALLGLRPRLHEGCVHMRPRLGGRRSIAVEDLRLGERRLRIEATGRTAVVEGDLDGLEVVIEG